MAADHVAVASGPVGARRSGTGSLHSASRRPRWGLGLLTLAFVVAAGGGIFYMSTSGKEHTEEPGREGAAGHEGGKSESAGSLPNVEVVAPKRGGMQRTTNQPGSVMAFDFAPLYAKVSGYLSQLNVDRGSRVKKDELLLEIFDPELDAAVLQARAELDRAKASVDVAQSLVKVAKANVVAADAMRHKARADLQNAVAKREYRSKQLNRISDLAKRDAVEERLVDEQRDDYLSSMAAEQASHAGIETADAQYLESQAKQEQAEADLKAARADVGVAEANLKKAQVFLDYTKLRAPYDGVVIYRGEAVHPGAFIQSATEKVDQPLLTVAGDDVMRTIILVPDRDVAHCDLGDPAIVRIDALGGREYKGVVSRMAESEDIHDRTMRVEVDLPNPKHELRHGMWGRAEIILEKDTPNLTVPSSCIIDRNSQGEGAVQVVRDGKIYKQSIQIGRDDGVRGEILRGLEPNAQVVLQPDASMADGTSVKVESSANSPGESGGTSKAAEPATTSKASKSDPD
jgi:HlyD family secretion protein